jgi:hypothetical protein
VATSAGPQVGSSHHGCDNRQISVIVAHSSLPAHIPTTTTTTTSFSLSDLLFSSTGSPVPSLFSTLPSVPTSPALPSSPTLSVLNTPPLASPPPPIHHAISPLPPPLISHFTTGDPNEDFLKCNSTALSMICQLYCFLYHGDIYFTLIKADEQFTFSFYEWDILQKHKNSILSALDQCSEWNLDYIWYMHGINNNDYDKISLHKFRAIKVNSRGYMQIHVVCTFKYFAQLKQAPSSQMRITLTKPEIIELLQPSRQARAFEFHVRNLRDCRTTINTVIVAIVHLIRQYVPLTRSNSIRQLNEHKFADVLTQLFGVEQRTTRTQLRNILSDVFESLAIDKQRLLSAAMTLDDILLMIFPAQNQYVLELYNTGFSSFFSCPVDGCVVPTCSGSCAQPAY